MNAEDPRLREVLRESRWSPSLPPRFQEGVWNRIEKADRIGAQESQSWLDQAVVWLLRPRAALAAAAVFIVAGAVLGARDGVQLARRDAQAQYLAAVAPNSLR
jgi:hypothetical protein